jgi:putative ABC transport system ATP-binding protein
MRPAIELRQVSKEYKIGGTRQRVLSKVDVTVAPGDFISIVGPSGSGKTTLAHILGGLTTPTEGELVVDGEPMQRARDRKLAEYRNKRVGFVFQNFGLLPKHTALENATLPLVLAKIPPRERLKKAEQVLRAVGLGKRLDSRVEQLSGGERQRVAIARALINNPQIIIADEPTGSLDSHQGSAIADLLQNIHAKFGVTLIVVTHSDELAARAPRRLHLLDGVVTEDHHA